MKKGKWGRCDEATCKWEGPDPCPNPNQSPSSGGLSGGAIAGIIIAIIVALGGAAGGVVYCKKGNMICFARKLNVAEPTAI